MHFLKRKNVILAIGAFFVLLLGYRIVAQQLIATNAISSGVRDSVQAKEVKQQTQVKSLPSEPVEVLTKGQKEELIRVKKHSLIYKGPAYKKQAALTFDDGPDRNFTPQILDILEQNHVSATFFVQGCMSRMYPEVLQRIDQGGHTIGNHSYNHPSFPKISNSSIEQQLLRTEDAIWEAIGKRPTLFRPPYGSVSKRVVSQVKKREYRLVQWSIDTNDWRGRSAERIEATVRRELCPGCIILQHSSGSNLKGTVNALPVIIRDLKNQGYEFVTIDQMLDVPAYRGA